MRTSVSSLLETARGRLDELEGAGTPAATLDRLRRLVEDAAVRLPGATGVRERDAIEAAVEAGRVSADAPAAQHVRSGYGRVERRLIVAAFVGYSLWVGVTICSKAEGFWPAAGLILAAFGPPLLAAEVAGWTLRVAFSHAGRRDAEESGAAVSFRNGFLLGYCLPTGWMAMGVAPSFPDRGALIVLAVVGAVGLVGGFCIGGRLLAGDLGTHARRREMLRDVIRRADDLLLIADRSKDRADDQTRSPASDQANHGHNASGEDAGDPLPPHIAALARVLGHLAKADGRVTTNEIACAEGIVTLLEVEGGDREAFVRAFGAGKGVADLSADLAALRDHCGADEGRGGELMGYLIMVAQADGHVGPEEAAVLAAAEDMICGGVTNIAGLVDKLNEDSPYAVLGLTPPCTREEAKRAHRKKAAELHPDKLRHQNLPQEMRAFAEARYRAVNEAYETIKGDLG